jgi:hypothetical protein
MKKLFCIFDLLSCFRSALQDEQIDDANVIAEYGVKLINYEYDKPIENSFK